MALTVTRYKGSFNSYGTTDAQEMILYTVPAGKVAKIKFTKDAENFNGNYLNTDGRTVSSTRVPGWPVSYYERDAYSGVVSANFVKSYGDAYDRHARLKAGNDGDKLLLRNMNQSYPSILNMKNGYVSPLAPGDYTATTSITTPVADAMKVDEILLVQGETVNVEVRSQYATYAAHIAVVGWDFTVYEEDL